MSAPVIQFALTVYGAKTASEGLKEDNMAKAVMGGITAYMGFSGLTSASTYEASGALGSEAGKNIAQDAAQTTATEGAIEGGTVQAASQPVGEGIINSGAPETLTAEQYGAQQLDLIKQAYPNAMSGGTGLINSASAFTQKNPMLTYGGMQLVGNAMAGHAEQKWTEQQLRDERRREDEARKRRDYWAAPFSGPMVYDPKTGQFRQTGA